jgi:two-component system chemotaxis sensor kinase CheA
MAAFADQELLHDFLTEAGEMLEGLDVKLVELEGRPDDRDLLNEIFRGFHTIKGGGGFLEATALVELCHRAENLLDRLRNGSLTLTAEMLDVILAATAEVKQMFRQMEGQRQPEPSDPGLLKQIEAALEGRPAKLVSAAVPAADAPAAPAVPPTTEPESRWWASLLESLAGTACAPAPHEPPTPAAGPSPTAWGPSAAAPNTTAPSRGLGPAGTKPASGQAPRNAPPAKETTLRIDVSRFDHILNLSGEIGLTKNRLTCLRTEIVRKHRGDDSLKVLDSVVNQLDTLVCDLQSAVMKARMQPVGRVFQKYVRQARDLARQLGKEVELVLEGEDTEIDKNMIEELNDPLVHLVRNAVDHGVQTIEERRGLGKPDRAVVRLSARQAGDSIVIEIADDGRGMRPDVLRQKAIEKGVISADEAGTLDDRQALELIFRPGFSTKDQISDLSGRGVGMDVVMTNIHKLNGRIELHSEPGRGTRVTILLPLTLAILPVLIVGVAGQPYAMPLSIVREIISIADGAVQRVSGKPAINVRGEVLPVLELGTLLGKPAGGEGSGSIGVVATSSGQTFILTVDRLYGQDDVVIKPLAGFKPRGVAGATVSSEGVLVLVLEMRELMGEQRR